MNGPDTAWFKGVRVPDQARIGAGPGDRNVTFFRAGGLDDEPDNANQATYGSMPSTVTRITSA